MSAFFPNENLPDQQPVHATEDEEEQLSTFTNYGYEQFTNTWIGQPPVNFGAPRNHCDIQKMRDFYDYMASGPIKELKRDYDSALAISSAFSVTQTDVELYKISNFKKAYREEAIYEAVRKAQAETYPDNYHGYAASFDAEMARAPNNSSQLLLAQYGVPDFMEVFQTVLKAACPWAVTAEEGWSMQTAWSTLMKVREKCPEAWNVWSQIMWQEFSTFRWFFALDRSKCLEKKTHNGCSTHPYPAGKKPTQMIRILITTDKPPPTRETKPVLDAQMLEQYIENNVPEDNHVAPVTAETVLVQHANRLQITAAQREQLMRRPPGTRVPAYMNIQEEEEDSSGEENN
ncbi:hypothetical protein C8J57DRAFT_1244988 [Mycena rebaudengoi]|nr:hypothetical protein C8J57DRAFT_1244988 [Mycena rebaudengoi]